MAIKETVEESNQPPHSMSAPTVKAMVKSWRTASNSATWRWEP